MPEGIKYDQEKPQMALIDFDALEGLAKVLTFGASKYGADNWRGGIANSRIVSSLLRHLSAYQRGEDFDPESGLSHLDHIGCNWMFLSANAKQRPACDDRSQRVATGCSGKSACGANQSTDCGVQQASSAADPASGVSTSHIELQEFFRQWTARMEMEEAMREEPEAPWVQREDIFRFPPPYRHRNIEVLFRDGRLGAGVASCFHYGLFGNGSDIMAYRELT
jgi:hypothetical protein